LPYAWQVVRDLAGRLRAASEAGMADNQVPPPDEAAQGQLLRKLASDAMRGAVERYFGVRLAFQALAEFTTARAQILNQSPELTNC
jgi:hypothetical protein